MKKSLLVAIPLMLLAGNLIRVELVARAQIPAHPTPRIRQSKPRRKRKVQQRYSRFPLNVA